MMGWSSVILATALARKLCEALVNTSTKRDPVPFVLLVGGNYSGSTLAAFLLNSHPQITSIGEMAPVWYVDPKDYSCSCGSAYLECPFNKALVAEMEILDPEFSLLDWGTRYDLTKSRLANAAFTRAVGSNVVDAIRHAVVASWPPFSSSLTATTARIEKVARAALAVTGKTWFVDTTKNPGRARYLARAPGIDLRIVHLVKDARQGAASLVKRGDDDASSAAKRWKRTNLYAARTARLVEPDQFFRIRYPELAEDAQLVLDDLSAFLGIEPAAVPADFYATDHHVTGNAMRLREGAGVIRNDESWKTVLSEADLRDIARIAGDANHEFGFDWP